MFLKALVGIADKPPESCRVCEFGGEVYVTCSAVIQTLSSEDVVELIQRAAQALKRKTSSIDASANAVGFKIGKKFAEALSSELIWREKVTPFRVSKHQVIDSIVRLDIVRIPAMGMSNRV